LIQHVDGAALPQAQTGSSVDFENAVKAFEGALPACQELETFLKRNKMSCQLVPVTTPKGIVYAVCINAHDAEKYTSIMQAHFSSMVEREHEQEWQLKDVHLDGSDVTCPACGHTGQLQDGQCTDCGLMLGVNE
jgi:hypothetical protein